MNLAEKNEYIKTYLMPLSSETLRFMVADLVAENNAQISPSLNAGLGAELEKYKSRWAYIKADPDGARSLLNLLREGRGAPDDFDTMVDRIIESRKMLNEVPNVELTS